MFPCEFCKIRKKTYFAEHHQKTASDYSSINIIGNEGENWQVKLIEMIFYDIKTMYRFEPKCNLLRSTLQAKQQVSEAVVCRVLKILKTPQENICV